MEEQLIIFSGSTREWGYPEPQGTPCPKLSHSLPHILGHQGTSSWQLARAPRARSEGSVACCSGEAASACRGQSPSLELA